MSIGIHCDRKDLISPYLIVWLDKLSVHVYTLVKLVCVYNSIYTAAVVNPRHSHSQDTHAQISQLNDQQMAARKIRRNRLERNTPDGRGGFFGHRKDTKMISHSPDNDVQDVFSSDVNSTCKGSVF